MKGYTGLIVVTCLLGGLFIGTQITGNRNTIVINTVETVEKVIEKPVVQVVETVVEKIIEKPVVEYVEKPVIKKIYRKHYIRNPIEFMVCGGICFLIGLPCALYGRWRQQDRNTARHTRLSQ